MDYPAVTLNEIRACGFTGRAGHPCLYDAIAKICAEREPESYLEIGVFDGASLFTAIKYAPLKRIVVCDIFSDDWRTWEGGTKRTWQDTLDGVLETLDYQGSFTAINESSLTAIPALTEMFDMVTIDGEHNDPYPQKDFENAHPHLRVGGILVFDDSGRKNIQAVTATFHNYKELFTLFDGRDATTVYEKLR
ncbi:MAG: class I SAM-dependent methyltransferase [Candidatus Micrarchaeota archaeon]|nr:class I SAM-dependent methyltransferase [Candidatus Micrarchaeota archaeon]